MIPFVFVTLLLVSAAEPTPAYKGHSFSAHHRHAARAHRRSARISPPSAPARSDAYGMRARRRFAAYVRLRLLEMREAGLERAASVVERRLPIDTLVPPLHDRAPPRP